MNISSHIHRPFLGEKVNSGMGLTYCPARLHGLAGRYENPMPESTIVYPPFRDYEFGYWYQESTRNQPEQDIEFQSLKLNITINKCFLKSVMQHLAGGLLYLYKRKTFQK